MSDFPSSAPGQKTSYRVQLPVFEGPLDLLLNLIERDELDITRISLALVTDQYLEYLSALAELQVDDLTDFVVVAARLLLIKSQVLLPRPPISVSQDEDAAGELLRQLLAYKQFKEAAKRLEERHIQGQRSYVRLAPQPQLQAGIEHLEIVPLEALVAAARRAMQKRPATPPANNIVAPLTITIADQIDLITRRLARQPKLSFTQLLTAVQSRHEIIVTLMAVLELIKQQLIQARQERMFGEIVLSPLPPPLS